MFEVATVVVVSPLTVCVSAAEVLGSKFALPAYVAVIECVPTVSEETVSCAEFPPRVALPREVEPSRNVTVPVAVVPAGG